jgi:hypothetical protein
MKPEGRNRPAIHGQPFFYGFEEEGGGVYER